MNIDNTQFNKAAKTFSKVSLSEPEKRSMLAHIYEEAEIEPQIDIPSPWGFSLIAAHRPLAVFSVFLLLGIGTTYAAGSSLPGEGLYPLKVRFIEPAVLAFHLNESQKHAYKVTLLQKRILELEELRRQDRLNIASGQDSYRAAGKNVADIEQDTPETAASANVEVSAYIEAYNDLTDPEFHLKTIVDPAIEKGAASTTLNAKVPVELPVIEATIEVASDVSDVPAEVVVETTHSVIKPVIPLTDEITKPIEKTVAPIKGGLGL